MNTYMKYSFQKAFAFHVPLRKDNSVIIFGKHSERYALQKEIDYVNYSLLLGIWVGLPNLVIRSFLLIFTDVNY